LSLRSLRSFVAVAEDLHFGRAAARLDIAQPSLSHQIKALEAVLGAPLLRRTKRTVALTDAGRAVLPDARRLLAQAERMRTHVRRVAAGEVGEVRVGFVASGAYGMLPAIARQFRRKCPDAHLEVDECDLKLPLEQLVAGTLDLAIVRGPVSHPTLRVEPLLREPLCVVLPERHRLAARARIPLRALAGEAFALFPRHRNPAFHDAITGFCRDAGFVPRIAHEAADWQVVASLVAAGMAITLAPASVRTIPRAGVCYRALSPAREIAELDIVYSPSLLSPLAQVFLEVARASVRDRQPRRAS
jgi:DNA-binding transcriptional LysR family regulator